MPKANDTTWELLVDGDELSIEAKRRGKAKLECSVFNKEVPDFLSKGWSEKKKGKTKTQLIMDKTLGDSFEDRVWSIFYKMGFTTMNKTNDFHLRYSVDHSDLTKQLDVVAIDDETCLFVECKSAAKSGTKKDFQKDIQEIGNLFSKLCIEIEKKYPKRKCKYIFATNNYIVGEMDRKRLVDNGIPYFDDNAILYYEKLVEYLGSAAKYQLLGSIFSGQKIANMETNIPAIRGFMGNLSYYSFLIKPADLLKIGYVLHRTNANNDYEDLLPSYQRLIKKDRLSEIRKFVNEGNFFPNSLIISIDTKKGKQLQFDLAGKKYEPDKLMQMGILHLPAIYQSAYIIDGQHRLYGYSDSNYANTNSIPVVAFENLSKETQLKLFMEINENQKAVSKALRNILEIDIYYDSENVVLSKRALLGMIAKRLGEDPQSPLYGRVIIGEDAQTTKCCITIDYIKAALEKTSFFNKYKKNGALLEKGLFDNGKNNDTLNAFYPFLVKYLSMIQELCTEEWESYITKNNAIVAVIRILDDIVSIVLEKQPDAIEKKETLFECCSEYIIELGATLEKLPPEKREAIRNLRGDQAKEDSYRTIQMAMHGLYPHFTNESIEKYYKEKYTNYAANTQSAAGKIRAFLMENSKKQYDESDWKLNHLDQDHAIELGSRILKKEYSNKAQGLSGEVDEWAELTFQDYFRLINHSTHWSDVYKELFSSIGIEMNKVDCLALLKSVGEIYDKAKSGKSITLNEYEQVKKLGGKLLEDM